MASEEMWFALVSSYQDMGGLLRILSLVGIILYFVTSSDSGSLFILFTKITSTLSYSIVRGLYFLAVIFVATIVF